MLKKVILAVTTLVVVTAILYAGGAQEGAGGSGEAASGDLSDKDLVTERRIGNPDAETTPTMTVLPNSYWTTPYESRANYLESAYE